MPVRACRCVSFSKRVAYVRSGGPGLIGPLATGARPHRRRVPSQLPCPGSFRRPGAGGAALTAAIGSIPGTAPSPARRSVSAFGRGSFRSVRSEDRDDDLLRVQYCRRGGAAKLAGRCKGCERHAGAQNCRRRASGVRPFHQSAEDDEIGWSAYMAGAAWPKRAASCSSRPESEVFPGQPRHGCPVSVPLRARQRRTSSGPCPWDVATDRPNPGRWDPAACATSLPRRSHPT